MATKNNTNKDNLKYALCYIPLAAFIFFFIENNKSATMMKHIKYGGALFVMYLVGSMLPFFGGIVALLYILASVFLAYKAYNGENIDLEVIDNMETKIKEGFDDDKNKKSSS